MLHRIITTYVIFNTPSADIRIILTMMVLTHCTNTPFALCFPRICPPPPPHIKHAVLCCFTWKPRSACGVTVVFFQQFAAESPPTARSARPVEAWSCPAAQGSGPLLLLPGVLLRLDIRTTLLTSGIKVGAYSRIRGERCGTLGAQLLQYQGSV